MKHVRRKDFDAAKRVVHIRASKNETSKRVIPLNDSAFDAVQRMMRRADTLGHCEPHHYLWCPAQREEGCARPPGPNLKRPRREVSGINNESFSDEWVWIVGGLFVCAMGSAAGVWAQRRSMERDFLPRKAHLEALLKELDAP